MRESVIGRLRAQLGGSWRFCNAQRKWVGRVKGKTVRVSAQVRCRDDASTETAYVREDTRETVFALPLRTQRRAEGT